MMPQIATEYQILIADFVQIGDGPYELDELRLKQSITSMEGDLSNTSETVEKVGAKM